jgi:hypothetical protein
MSLLCSTRLASTRRLLVCLALGTLLLFAFRSHFRLWRARFDYRSSINGGLGSDADSSNDPRTLMAKADHFYWLNNGPRAAALYAKAEQLFAKDGDTRNEISTKVGRMRSEAETMSFVELSRFLEDELHNPIVDRDKQLRLRCLVAKGYTTSRVTGSMM